MITNFEGTINATTLTCDVASEGIQVRTQWRVANLRGSGAGLQLITKDFVPELFMISGEPGPTFTFGNQLIISNLTSELDGVTVYCGTNAEPQKANFVVRLYRKLVSVSSV